MDIGTTIMSYYGVNGYNLQSCEWKGAIIMIKYFTTATQSIGLIICAR